MHTWQKRTWRPPTLCRYWSFTNNIRCSGVVSRIMASSGFVCAILLAAAVLISFASVAKGDPEVAYAEVYGPSGWQASTYPVLKRWKEREIEKYDDLPYRSTSRRPYIAFFDNVRRDWEWQVASLAGSVIRCVWSSGWHHGGSSGGRGSLIRRDFWRSCRTWNSSSRVDYSMCSSLSLCRSQGLMTTASWKEWSSLWWGCLNGRCIALLCDMRR